MTPVKQTLSAVGITPWVILNYTQNAFAVTVAAIPSSNAATVALAAQLTYDDQSQRFARPVTIARAAALATVTDPLHGMSTNDAVTIYASGSNPAANGGSIDGEQQTITVVDVNTYTFPCANAGPTVMPSAFAVSARIFPLAAITGAVRVATSLISTPVMAVRFQLTTLTAGFVDFITLQGLGT